MSSLTDRAEQLLAGITPGPWAWVHDGDVLTSNSGEVLGGVWYNDNSAGIFADDADAAFIAAAPTLVADLLAEVKRLTPREITTVAELRTLPAGARVLDANGRQWAGNWPLGFGAQGGPPLPATVLYLPEGGE